MKLLREAHSASKCHQVTTNTMIIFPSLALALPPYDFQGSACKCTSLNNCLFLFPLIPKTTQHKLIRHAPFLHFLHLHFEGVKERWLLSPQEKKDPTAAAPKGNPLLPVQGGGGEVVRRKVHLLLFIWERWLRGGKRCHRLSHCFQRLLSNCLNWLLVLKLFLPVQSIHAGQLGLPTNASDCDKS